MNEEEEKRAAVFRRRSLSRRIPRPSMPRYRPMPWAGVGLGLIVVVVIALFFAGCTAYRSSAREVTITVTRMDDQATADGHQYLVFTPQGVFVDKDSLLFLKFSSSDLFNQLQEGHRYRCKVVGWRLHWTSNYPNLISCVDA